MVSARKHPLLTNQDSCLSVKSCSLPSHQEPSGTFVVEVTTRKLHQPKCPAGHPGRS
ncbi:hypothetical protein CEXT_449231, partial [Caerostris extrusa]